MIGKLPLPAANHHLHGILQRFSAGPAPAPVFCTAFFLRTASGSAVAVKGLGCQGFARGSGCGRPGDRQCPWGDRLALSRHIPISSYKGAAFRRRRVGWAKKPATASSREAGIGVPGEREPLAPPEPGFLGGSCLAKLLSSRRLAGRIASGEAVTPSAMKRVCRRQIVAPSHPRSAALSAPAAAGCFPTRQGLQATPGRPDQAGPAAFPPPARPAHRRPA